MLRHLHESIKYRSWCWWIGAVLTAPNFPCRAYQMTKFHELCPHCGSGQERMWFLPCLCLLKRNWPASMKLVKAQQPNHNTCMKTCVPMPFFSPFPHVSAQSPDTWRRSSCCFLTFSQRPALHHWNFVTCANTYTHTHVYLMQCSLWRCSESAKLWSDKTRRSAH